MRTVLVGLISLAAFLFPLSAQSNYEFWPGTRYDPAIPTENKVLGYRAGEQMTTPENIVRYLEALAAAAPARMKVYDYGKTWEGRRLVYAVIGSEANIRRLAVIRAGMQKLAHPRRTTEAEAKRLIGTLPAPVWLAYGIHGNEVSSPDAALVTAYHLLAARNDKVVSEILKDAVVFIDPLENPDGRNRFVNYYVQSEGLEPNADPDALEHTEGWPKGRTNHYLFDMNRDWFALTQPETRGRVKVLQEWYPLVFVDFHEMGANSTYYFGPAAVPYNPNLTTVQKQSEDWFGRNNARWFDRFGFSYFTREVFDAFYPGYGDGWPAYYGSVAMTYEQASPRGLLMRRRIDGKVFDFREALRHHFVSSVSTCQTAARHRRQLLANFYRYRQTAIERGAKGTIKAYILPRTGDPSAVDKLADLLAREGIEVKRSTAPFQAGGSECPAGSYLISLAQPAERLIRTLLEPEVAVSKAFLKEQIRRMKKHLPNQIYDVLAWSLPLMYNVKLISRKSAVAGNFEPVVAGRLPKGKLRGGTATVAYLVPWGSAASGRLLTAALRKGLKVWTADKKFKLNGEQFPRGTLIFKVPGNPGDIESQLEKLAASTGAGVVAASTGYVVKGISLGSNHVLPIRKPRVALAWDRPTSPTAAGNTRFVIERQFGYPTTPIRTRRLPLPETELDRFDVLILPSGPGKGYTKVLGKKGARRLKEWVARGGTLIGISGALDWLCNPKVDLLAVSREDQPRTKNAKKKTDKKPEKRKARVPGELLKTEADYEKAITPEDELPIRVPGVLVRANLDPDNWITAGLARTVNVMVQGRGIYTPIKLDKGVNAALFAGPGQLRASGYLWKENQAQLAYKPFVIVQPSGRGMVIGFTQDPNFRAFMDGLNMLFLNAIFRSQAPIRAEIRRDRR